MNALKAIPKFAKSFPKLIQVGKGANAADVDQLEERLGVKLPRFYRRYLETFGTVSIGSEEFFGFVRAVNSRDVGNVVLERDRLIKDWQLPNNLIPVLSEEGDSYLCIDTATGKQDLLRWFKRVNKCSRTQDTFEEFLVQLCHEIIEDEGDDQNEID